MEVRLSGQEEAGLITVATATDGGEHQAGADVSSRSLRLALLGNNLRYFHAGGRLSSQRRRTFLLWLDLKRLLTAVLLWIHADGGGRHGRRSPLTLKRSRRPESLRFLFLDKSDKRQMNPNPRELFVLISVSRCSFCLWWKTNVNYS